jgi:hypothetical protein
MYKTFFHPLTNMAIMHNFEVTAEKLNTVKICTMETICTNGSLNTTPPDKDALNQQVQVAHRK